MLAKKIYEPLTDKIDTIEELSKRLSNKNIPAKPTKQELKLYETVMCPLYNRKEVQQNK